LNIVAKFEKHLIYFFNPATLTISRVSFYMAYATLRYQQVLIMYQYLVQIKKSLDFQVGLRHVSLTGGVSHNPTNTLSCAVA